MKTLVVTEKKSVADDFAKVLGRFAKKGDLSYERDDMVISWASGHLLELKGPAAYDDKYKRWTLTDLPILPPRFERGPRESGGRGTDLLKNLVRQMRRKDVGTIINACDAGREGELIFNLILDHAKAEPEAEGGVTGKTVRRLWLQSMTSNAIRQAFDELKSSDEFRPLRDAAYARDEADWLVGMNGTRGFTKKFMGRAKQFFAVGRVKTPTLAFLVDREREIDAFRPTPYFQIDATFDTGSGLYTGRWTGPDESGKKNDRLQKLETAKAIAAKVGGKTGVATEKHTSKSEIAPLLYDLTTLQREASNRYGFTLDRTLSIAQSLYEAKKAITYPRTSSRFLPSDYTREIPRLVSSLREGDLAGTVARALAEVGGTIDHLKPVVASRVFNDAKVSDHFALIPTGENPKNLRDDERKIYEMIVRRFLAAFLPEAQWDQVARDTVVEGELFATRERRLAKAGWRAVEPAPDYKELPPLAKDGRVRTTQVDVLEKETQAPARYTDGSLVKAMETAGKDLARPDGDAGEAALDDDRLEELKEKGIGTPATRAAIVKDLIDKGLARRAGRNILPTPLGCTLVRIVRNLDLGVLAKPDLTGTWEYRLMQMAQGGYRREEWDHAIRQQVTEIVDALRRNDGGNETVFAVDHPKSPPLRCPACKKPLIEKTFSYLCADADCAFMQTTDGRGISKDQKGKYLFPETMALLLRDGSVGPLSGFEGTRAAGMLELGPDYAVEIKLATGGDAASPEDEVIGDENRRETVPDGTLMGQCPKCGSKVTRDGTGYRCEKNIARAKDKTCDFRLAEKIKYRFLPPDQIRKLLSGQKTDELFGFVSMRGKKFKATLFYKDGELQWEFPPRKAKAPKAGELPPGESPPTEGEAERPRRAPPPRRPRKPASDAAN